MGNEVVTANGKVIRQDQPGCVVDILIEPSQAYLDSLPPITEPDQQPPSLEDRLAAAESAIVALMGV